MNSLSIFFVAFALSCDAMAVAMANGAKHHDMKIGKMLKIALFFGFFQLLMPIIGWFMGSAAGELVVKYGQFISFALLLFLGIKMIFESQKPVEEKEIDINSIRVLLLLSVATSVDALVVGFSFALLSANIWLSSVLIGLITFVLSLLSIKLGMLVGEKWGKNSEIFGGLVLIIIGFRILM